MGEYRIRMVGRSDEDDFAIIRREGDHWIWLPVRFSTYNQAARWIARRQADQDARDQDDKTMAAEQVSEFQ
jgi:hypothetical protein